MNIRHNRYHLYRLVPQPAHTFAATEAETSYQIYSNLCTDLGLLPVVDGAINSISSYCGENGPAWMTEYDYMPTQGWVGRGGFFPGLAWATGWGGATDDFPGVMAFGICGSGCGWPNCDSNLVTELVNSRSSSDGNGWGQPLSPICGSEDQTLAPCADLACATAALIAFKDSGNAIGLTGT